MDTLIADDRTVAIAHRVGDAVDGATLLARVNLLARSGFKMVECDVRRTSDGVLVIHHDAECAALPVARHPYREIAERAPIVTLEMLLETIGDRLALDLELKESGYEGQVMDLLASMAPGSLIVTSFLDDAISAVKRIAPSVRTGLLAGGFRSLHTPASLYSHAFPFARMGRAGADLLVADYHLFVGSGLAVRAKLRGIKVILWTVNDSSLYRSLALLPGVAGIITDLSQVP